MGKAQIDFYARKKAARLASEKIACACTCGEMIPAINSVGKPARFALGHNSRLENESTPHRFPKGQEPWNKGKAHDAVRGKRNPNWTGGRIVSAKGVRLLMPDHPDADSRGYVGENRWVMEQTLGRPLKKSEIVQNINGDLTDNRPENLRLTTLSKRLRGKNNPFYGKKHTEESLAKMSASQSGKRRKPWIKGKSGRPYPPEFSEKLKRLIKQRDGYRCQNCGKTQKQIKLEIHHIDHDPANSNLTNLVTVCHSCNMYFSYHPDESLAAFPMRKFLLTEDATLPPRKRPAKK